MWRNRLQSKVFRNTLGLTLFNDKSLPLSLSKIARCYARVRKTCYKIRFTFYLVRIFPRYIRSLKCDGEEEKKKQKNKKNTLLPFEEKWKNLLEENHLYSSSYGDCAFVLLLYIVQHHFSSMLVTCEEDVGCWYGGMYASIRFEKTYYVFSVKRKNVLSINKNYKFFFCFFLFYTRIFFSLFLSPSLAVPFKFHFFGGGLENN